MTEATTQPRGASRSALYRTQFRWAEDAVHASSTIAAAWLLKPDSTDDDAIVLALFYFKTPGKGRHKAQVWRIVRNKGRVSATFIGSAEGHKEAHRVFYQPLLKDVRATQKAAKKAAAQKALTAATKAVRMAARVKAGVPGKNDKRDLAVATGGVVTV